MKQFTLLTILLMFGNMTISADLEPTVSEAVQRSVYIEGAVENPKIYKLKDGENLHHLLSKARLRFNAREKIVIIRGTGEVLHYFLLDLDEVRKKDFVLEDGDRVFISGEFF